MSLGPKIDRRRLLQGGTALLGASALPGVRAAAAPGRITVTCYGGDWEKAVRDFYIPVFTRNSGGAQADVLLGDPAQWIAQIEASRQHPPIHVTLMSADLAIKGGRMGLFEKPDAAKVPNLQNVPQSFRDIVEGWGVCSNYGAALLGYHKERVKNPPKSYKELVDRTASGELRTALPGVGYSFMPTMVLWPLADVYGGNVDNVSPAFDAIKRMLPNTVFWNDVTEFPSMLQSGDADIGVWFDGRIWATYDAGAKWLGALNPEEGAPMIPTPVMKVANAPDLAWDYVNAMLDPVPQLKFAELLNYPVTNDKVAYPTALRERFTPWQKTRLPPFGRLSDVVGEWVDRWNREIRR